MRKEGAVVRVASFVSVLFGGLFAGFLVGVLVIELTLRGYDGAAYTQVRMVMLEWLDLLATVTLLPTLAAVVVLVGIAARGRGRSLWPLAAALALLAFVLVTSLVVNVPINGEQQAWDVAAPPADWATVRDRWQAAHALRTGAAVIAFGLLSAAAMGRPSRAGRSAPRSEHGRSPESEPARG